MGTSEQKMDGALQKILQLFKNYKGSHIASIMAEANSGKIPIAYSLGNAKARRAKKKRKQVMRQRYVERRKSWRKCRKAA